MNNEIKKVLKDLDKQTYVDKLLNKKNQSTDFNNNLLNCELLSQIYITCEKMVLDFYNFHYSVNTQSQNKQPFKNNFKNSYFLYCPFESGCSVNEIPKIKEYSEQLINGFKENLNIENIDIEIIIEKVEHRKNNETIIKPFPGFKITSDFTYELGNKTKKLYIK